MERSSSLGEYAGRTPQQVATTSGRLSSGVTVTGRKVYPFDQGFCYIPKGEWTRGLERAQGAPFHVTSMRHAMIIPAGDFYPHLTLDVQETYAEEKVPPPRMKVRISHVHYSPSQSGARLAFHCRGVQLVPNRQYDRKVLGSVQRYLERTHLPFRLPESLLTEQPKAVPVTVAEDIKPPLEQLEGLSLEEKERADSPTSSARSRSKRDRSRGSKKNTVKKVAPGRPGERPTKPAMAVVESGSGATPDASVTKAAEGEVDAEKLWCDEVALGNFLVALDTLTVDKFGDSELKFATAFYGLGRKNVSAKVAAYAEKFSERSKVSADAMSRDAKLVDGVTQVGGARSKLSRQGVQRVTQRKIEEDERLVGYPEVLDYGLHQLVPAELMEQRLRPDAKKEPEKFEGYKCAMLLLFRTLASECHEMRCAELYYRALPQCSYVGMVCNREGRSISYFESLIGCLNTIMSVVNKGNHAKSVSKEEKVTVNVLKRIQDSLEPLREVNENGIQVFYQFTIMLMDISNQLLSLTRQDWRDLSDSIRDEQGTLTALDMEDKKNWQKALQSLERVRDEVVRIRASTASSS